MSRASSGKRPRPIDCDGGRCGHPECTSCDMASLGAMHPEGKRLKRTEERIVPEPSVSSRPLPAPSSILEPWDQEHWWSKISAIPDEQLRPMLVAFTSISAPARQLVDTAYNIWMEGEQRRREAEKARVLDFDHESKSAWYVLNKKYSSSKGSVEYNNAFNAMEEVLETLKETTKEAHANNSFGTRKSALETLRKIGKSVCLAPSTLGSEVRKHMQYDDTLRKGMLGILNSMTDDERATMAQAPDRLGVSFLSKVQELAGEADGLCIFEGLDAVIDLLDPADDEEEDVDKDGNENEKGDSTPSVRNGDGSGTPGAPIVVLD